MRSTNRRRAQPNSSAPDILRSLAERIVRLKEEIKGLQSDIKDVKNEANNQGFDKKALMVVVARMMEEAGEKAARQETEALADLYLASLGMLDGTPLGDAARRKMDDPPPPAPDDDGRDDDADDEAGHRLDGDDASNAEPPAGAMSQEQIDAARAEGERAASEGQKVFANPYVAGDPRRAAWDEGWCRHAGSDGMDLPAAFRRRPKKPDGDASRRSDDGR